MSNWWNNSWWNIFTGPFDIIRQSAFNRVFDGIITARNALRKAYQESQRAQANLVEFYDAFTALPSSAQQSRFRSTYQDLKSSIDAENQRLDRLSIDLATIQDIVSKAFAGTIPYDIIAEQVAVLSRGLVLREVSHSAAEETTNRMTQGVGVFFTGTVVFLLAVVTLILSAATATAQIFIKKHAGTTAANLEIARMVAAQDRPPKYIEGQPSVLSDAATTASAAVSIATIGLVLAGGLWLAKRT